MASRLEAAIPQAGMLATVRNRRGTIASVEPFDGDNGRLHLVQVEYKDDQIPLEQQLIWELEPRRSLLEPTALPLFADTDPMPAEDCDALLRATRWTATLPKIDPDKRGAAAAGILSKIIEKGSEGMSDEQAQAFRKALDEVVNPSK